MSASNKGHSRQRDPQENDAFPETTSGILRIERFIEPCILLLLAQRNRHGYALRDELVQIGLAQEVDFGNLYRTLRRMERGGIVESHLVEQSTAPTRRVYRITPQGRTLLGFWVSSLRQTKRVLDRFLHAYRNSSIKVR